MTRKSSLCAYLCLFTMTSWLVPPASAQTFSPIQHVLVISIDGMHSLDFALYVKNNPNSNLAMLAANGWNYTAAETTKPSDSIPSTVGIFTGGTPAVAGMWYDDAYHRGYSPSLSVQPTCSTIGTLFSLKQDIDVDPLALNTTLDPTKLPRDPAKGCAPVYPHNMLRVNTVFEVAKAAGLHTAYSEKRPAYDFLNGPSGTGVDDLYVPEIGNVITNVAATEAFDDLRVASVLNEINGKNSSGTATAAVPAIFGMNFQSVNAGKKVGPGGYLDALSTPTPGLQGALDYVDTSIGKFVTALRAKPLLWYTTTIIITAKHGESALDPNHRTIVPTTGAGSITAIVNSVAPGLAKKVTQKTSAFIWLADQTRTNDVVAALTLPANQTAANIGQVLSGESLKLLFNDPLIDPAVPDIIVWTNTGTNAEPAGSTVFAEHGGLSENDAHVPLLVWHPLLDKQTIRTPVKTTQLAPTIVALLGLRPSSLQAVQQEGTEILPIPTAGFLAFLKSIF
jgi:hypothetical protein